jgi:hypothetical protein
MERKPPILDYSSPSHLSTSRSHWSLAWAERCARIWFWAFVAAILWFPIFGNGPQITHYLLGFLLLAVVLLPVSGSFLAVFSLFVINHDEVGQTKKAIRAVFFNVCWLVVAGLVANVIYALRQIH